MRPILLTIALAACGSDSPTYDCGMLAKTVTQQQATCRIPADPAGIFGCPDAIAAYCLPDGRIASCPSGWGLGCEVDSAGNDVNCTYGGDHGCMVSGDVATFDYAQTLNGVQGLGVRGADGRCTFEACEPL